MEHLNSLETIVGFGLLLIAGGVAWGMLRQRVAADENDLSEFKKALKEQMATLRSSLDDRLDDARREQAERHRMHDSRTKNIERKLEAHGDGLADMRAILARVDTNLAHLVKAVDSKT